MRKLRYQALGPLLAGEGSRAFLGLEISNESKARPVVLVWVPDEANKNPVLLGRIQRETEHAATLDHPNIVRVIGFVTLDEGHARVVEFADGESVRRILEVTHFLPPRFAAKIAADAAMGVHYAHVAGNDDGAPLLHGDLRPETLIVTFAGGCKASGYGALKVAPDDRGGKRVLGRRLHSAPEQVIGGREAMVPQTDVYLLGLTLYECLTG
ncbi:MAG: protein kinase domain-containing protein [Myxococcaceae bacterium]